MEFKKNRNYFRITRFILLKLPSFFKAIAKLRKPEKRLLLIRTDAIGDYILFRNYIQVVAESEKFKGYKIDLVGNSAWKDICTRYDNSYLDKIWFIKENDLYEEPLRVLRLGWSLFKRRYSFVLQPTYSRTLMSNGLAGLAAGLESIAYNSDLEHHAKYKRTTDRFYTQLIDLPKEINHELEKNHFYFRHAASVPDLPLISPSLPVTKYKTEGIVIFPGSSSHRRNWQKEKFVEIIKRLQTSTQDRIVVAGGERELELISEIMAQLPERNRVESLSGKQSLVELIELLANSRLLISNETGAVHIAAALATPSICLLGGGHFGRFTPYPDELTHKPVCVYQPMDCYYCNWNCKFSMKDEEAYPCIAAIGMDNVWLEVQKILHQ